MKPIDQMSPSEICAEAASLRKGLEATANRLVGLYSALYSKVRRQAPTEMAYAHLSVANNGKRFAGVVVQASRRAEVTETRALLIAQRGIESQAREKEAKEAKARKSASEGQSFSNYRPDALELLFGIPSIPEEVIEDPTPDSIPTQDDDLEDEDF